MNEPIFLGVDGGATGTRARAVDAAGRMLGEGRSGPSNLNFGIETAWQSVADACAAALSLADAAAFRSADLHHVAMACGIAGAANTALHQEFLTNSPDLGRLLLVEDGLTTLLGAHGGDPGVVVAIGTGTIGFVLTPTGDSHRVGGWGFPIGDEGSGAWLGWRALGEYLQQLDGRLPITPDNALYKALRATCGSTRLQLLDWLYRAPSTKFATLAPLVVKAAEAGDETARAHMQAAGGEVARIALALDPARALPLALTGGLARSLASYLPDNLGARCVPVRGDALDGALLLARGVNPVKIDES